MDPCIINICGCDGSGKSTILEHLKQQYPATYIKEPHNDAFIKQIKETNDVFKQIDLFAHDRYLLYKDIEFPLTTHLISDRSFICSLVYQSIEIETKHHWPPFCAINQVYSSQLAVFLPTLVIYVYARPSIIHHRLSERSEEHYLTINQIQRIQSRYDLIFKLFNLNVLMIDTTSTPIHSNISRIISNL